MAYKGLHNNKKALEQWKKRVISRVKEAEVKSLTDASNYFMEDLVKQAQYNDFTGSLNASYVAAIFHNGKYVRRVATSLPYAETAPISAKKGEIVNIRNMRIFTKRKRMRTTMHHYGKGFGNRTGKLRLMRPKAEYSILITNTAPYAEDVQNMSNRRVMLGSSNKYAGTFIKLLRSNLKNNK